ncbi:hypothetical protein PLANPX_1660 [Lacipirellula parvula]|uniref:Uncharacterized protein n=1 Tax=Lacipirellula parvula TaxID=2650471 RepID=A0A5K7X6A2_9BACT|nr:hypothetical protein PLANPX_1660 [Lacipirellula parvula]
MWLRSPKIAWRRSTFSSHVAAGQHSLIATRLDVTWACISLSAQGPDQVEAFPPQAGWQHDSNRQLLAAR